MRKIDLGPKPALPLAGLVRYATIRASVGDAGIVADHETGEKRRVLWLEVVGVVARRLPEEAPYSGETFVDVVSNEGSTLRILPWTELDIDGTEEIEAGDDRARRFVQLVAARCPEAAVDPATRTFLGSKGPAAQLPSTSTLAQHDDRLA
ncbi:hypothetical protein BH11MYX1_BH11MYX1_08610 [soil metagenome]